MQQISNWTVNKKRCKTCPFNDEDNGYMPSVERIKTTCLTESSHICHSTNSTICRGARDYQLTIFYRLGVIENPTDEAWAKKRNGIEKTPH